MNTLSILIYLADAFPKIANTIITISLISSVILLIVALISSVEQENHKYWKYLSIPCFFLLVASCIPNKGTVYAIAASELGEQAVKSEIGSDNDSTYKINAFYKEDLDEYEFSTLNTCIKKKYMEYYNLDLFIQDLVNKDILPTGTYVVSVSW